MTEGLVAPRDAEKNRPYFYIMREKEIFGLKQPDERGIQFIYQDNGRLIGSAQIVGNITDQDMLKLLEDTQGFRKLVHSIGVSVETEDPKEPIDFIFQMYGRTDTYGGGTQIRCSLKGDGAETRIHLSDVKWSEDDREPGQIRFEFSKPEILAVTSVRFYLNDGFCASEVSAEPKIDFDSYAYKQMIERSLISAGNCARVKKAIEKARRGENVTIAFIGGSITQGAGATPIHHGCYAYKSYRAFAECFGTGENIHFIKAGVGGTPSELGMLRFDRDVLRGKTEEPDIVVIEFAVNDAGDETKGNCYESLVRKVLTLPNQPAVILLFAVFANDWNLQERLSPVGYHYKLPMISLRDAVTPQFCLKPEEGRVLSKNQFFYDALHPNNNGHTIMADCLTWFFKKAEDTSDFDETESLLQKDPVIGCDFEKVKFFDRKENCQDKRIICGDFEGIDTDLQCVEMDENLYGTPQLPNNWMYQGKNKKGGFELRLCCRALLLVYKDSGAVTVGKAEIFVDEEKRLIADPHVNGWIHCNPVLLFLEKERREHVIRIQMMEGEEDKIFTILGFGYVE